MKKLLITFLVLLQFSYSLAQYDIQLQTIVAPPYTPHLADYISLPGKVTIIVKNLSAQNHSLVFGFSMESSNGSRVSSKIGLAAATPFLIGANQVRLVNTTSSELNQYFTSGNLEYSGVDNSFSSLNLLPEGDYTFCLTAYDKNTGIALSEKNCTDIPINYVDPPLILQPICGEDLMIHSVQNINFLWMPPATSSQDFDYEFTLKEIPLNYNIGRGKSNNLNPNDVIKSSYYPILFTTRLLTNNLNYNFRFPKLEHGKSYVWRIQAISRNKKITLKQNGYSEACVFNYLRDSFPSRQNAIPEKYEKIQSMIESKKTATQLQKIELLYPANKQIITWNPPQIGETGYHEFSWKKLDDSNAIYRLELVKMADKDENPSWSLSSNPHIDIPDNGTQSHRIKIHKQLSESGVLGGSFAWKIIAYKTTPNGKKIGESEPRVFYTLPINFGK